ncbi:LPXTG-motif cell wall anchor domain-containing protein [Clostridium amylolyticum]|uniref:LPXTG-motif cell wall anchor domain-containing protein n=1 Tax=Clostridium amylolyticum TaxID=1121298 RepID=A0A1M6FAS6_9CLOT|nr:Ig-like domain-containing protein [Clostridium amylolyticum]SHI94783.1 LPXTG-motif cell wall anchor domain-containing protein [Clostridium amylolyticum]
MKSNKLKIKFMGLMAALVFLLNTLFSMPLIANAENIKVNIGSEIESTALYVKNLNRYSFTETMALNKSNENIDLSKLNILNKYNSLNTYSSNVINIISAGGNPYNYKGVNYVGELVKSQQKSGYFVVNSEFEDISAENTAKAIIALDMAGAQYNKEAAVKALMSLSKANNNGKSFDENVNVTALSLIALSGYKNVSGADNLIKAIIEYLKKEQLSDGSFAKNSLANDDFDAEGNVQATAMVIQALSSLGINPLSEEWSKEGKNLLEVLLSFRKDGKFIYNSSYPYTSSEASNSLALGALLDVKSGGSIYKSIRYNPNRIPASISVQASSPQLKQGKSLKLEAKVFDKEGTVISGEDVIWTVDDDSIASIDAAGTLKALKPGKVNVSAALKKDSSIKANKSFEIAAIKPSRISLELSKKSITVGETVKANIVVKDQDGDVINPVPEVIYEVKDSSILTISKDNVLKGIKPGKTTVEYSLKSDSNIKAAEEVLVKETSTLEDINEEDKKLIQTRIEELKELYAGETVEALAPLALNKVGAPESTLNRVYVKTGTSALIYSQNIIALIGANKDPYKYKDKRGNVINFVDLLQMSQRPKGDEFEGKFVVGKYLDPKSAMSLSYSIIALELAKAEYDKELAARALEDMMKKQSNEDSTYDKVEVQAFAVLALSSHGDMPGVNDTIASLISNIKSMQQKDGSFGGLKPARAISMVIQALAANNINPLSPEWTKEKNMLQTLLSYKANPRLGKTVAGFAASPNGNMDLTSTYYGMAALADLLKGESIFGIKNNLGGKPIVNPEITITGVQDNKIYDGSVNIEISVDKGEWKAFLNEKEFNGGKVQEAGKYNLKVVAEAEGIKITKEINFIVDSSPYENIKVRIEGNKGTLFNKEVKSSKADTNAFDVLVKAIGAENIAGSGTPGESYFINALMGEKASGNFGWSYYVKKGMEIDQPMVSVDLFEKIKDSQGKFNYDELVFYMTHYEYDGEFRLYTNIPEIKVRSVENRHEISVMSKDSKLPLKNVEINVENVGKVITDDKGKAYFMAPEGIYNMTLGKRTASHIEVVPNAYTLSLPVAEEVAEIEYKEEQLIEILKDPFIRDIKVDLKENKVISKEVFKNLQNKNKEIQFTSGELTWTFNGQDISSEDIKDIDVTVSYSSKNDKSIKENFKDAYVLSFAENGRLPGKAKIKLNIKDKVDSKKLFLYYYNEEKQRAEKIAGPLVVNGDGLVEFYLVHNSDYFLSSIDGEAEKADKLLQVIKEVSQHYSGKDKYTFRNIMALRHLSQDINMDTNILKKYVEIKEIRNLSTAVHNVISLVAAGENPKNYKGVNYVKPLEKAQREDGRFSIEDGDEIWPTLQAYALMALDMSNGNYDKEKAVSALVNMAKNGYYGDVDSTSMVITALAPHKEIKGVKEVISSSLDFIKKSQLENGGFSSYGSENPYTISAVIQALVANGEDIYGEKWSKNGINTIDALLKYKEGNHFIYKSSWGEDIEMATEQAFSALADAYKNKSMYQEIKSQSNDESEKEAPIIKDEDTNPDDNEKELGNNNSETNVPKDKNSTSSNKDNSNNSTAGENLPKTGSNLDGNFLIIMSISIIALGVLMMRKKNKIS